MRRSSLPFSLVRQSPAQEMVNSTLTATALLNTWSSHLSSIRLPTTLTSAPPRPFSLRSAVLGLGFEPSTLYHSSRALPPSFDPICFPRFRTAVDPRIGAVSLFFDDLTLSFCRTSHPVCLEGIPCLEAFPRCPHGKKGLRSTTSCSQAGRLRILLIQSRTTRAFS